MKLPLIPLFFILAFATLNAEETTFKPYVNKDECYTVSLPSTWTVAIVEESDDVTAVSPKEQPSDKVIEHVEIWVAAVEDPGSLDEYFEHSLQNLQRHTTYFRIFSQGNDEIDGVDARWISAILTEGGATGQLLQYVMLKEGRVYILNFTAAPSAYESYEAIFKTIARSFRFVCD